jgi:A/G-specific adenine glycosylase
MSTPFAQKLLDWYAVHARTLPWRGHPDPYAVWISEIMLQQTRVETVIPYFERWLAKFPTVFELASAPQQAVLNLWEGLGYYRRARNLHKAAQVIVAEYAGVIPSEAAELQKLPGIGRYTAAAVASIAFDKDEAAVDGNIRRVLARVFNVDIPARSKDGESILWDLAAENLPSGQAGDHNQAIMDLGATICLPKNPDCKNCPLVAICQAKALGVQAERPVKQPKAKVPHHTVTAAVFQREGKYMIVQRPAKGLLGGMWEFPGGKQESGEDLPTCLQREICEELGVDIQVGESLGVYQHAYTHFKVTLHAFWCDLNGNEPQLREHTGLHWITATELDDFPMGKIDRQISQYIQRLKLEH